MVKGDGEDVSKIAQLNTTNCLLEPFKRLSSWQNILTTTPLKSKSFQTTKQRMEFSIKISFILKME